MLLHPLGSYLIDELVREETGGAVALARHADRRQAVLVRLLVPPAALEAEARSALEAAFLLEAERLRLLFHPAVPRPIDGGRSAAGQHFLVFERPEAKGWLPAPEDPRGLPPAGWIGLAAGVCGILEALVEAGLTVREFLPAQLYMAPDGSPRYLLLGSEHLLPGSGGDGPAAEVAGSLARWLYGRLTRGEVSPGRREPVWQFHPGLSAALDDALDRALAPATADLSQLRRSLEAEARRLLPGGGREPVRTAPAAAPEEEIDLGAILRVGGCITAAAALSGWILGQLYPR